MRRSITASFVALVALGSFVLPVHAEMIFGTFSGNFTLTPTGTPGIFVQNFTGTGNDTTFGSFIPHSQSTIDFSHLPKISITNGMLSETFSQGILSGTTSGKGKGNGNGTASFTADFVITGGTGLFAGATGDVTLTGTININTESAAGSYAGTLSLVPEPGVLGKLVPAVVAGAVVLLRQRRRKATPVRK